MSALILSHFKRRLSVISRPLYRRSMARCAAQRAIERRYKGREITDSRLLKWDKINADIQKIEQLFGKPAADMTRKVAEDMYGLLVGSSVHSLRTIVTPIKLNAENLQ